MNTPSSPSLPSISSSSFAAAARRSPATRIYIYDLPSKFMYGVIRGYILARNPHATPTSDNALRYPGHQHSAKWYLFPTSSAPTTAPTPPSAVSPTLKKPTSSTSPSSPLSLIVNPIGVANADTESKKAYSDEVIREELMEWLERQKY